MQTAARSQRVHIGIFGRCNVGKSSLLNVLANQQKAVVTEHRGTTTDPVYQTMELLPLGPVVLIDTPGLDDESLVGEQRTLKTKEVLQKTDIALLVTDQPELDHLEETLRLHLKEQNIPYLLLQNKIDLGIENGLSPDMLHISTVTKQGISNLKKRLGELPLPQTPKDVLEGLVKAGDMLLLVTPIDPGAPKGRLILPQQETLRSILDHQAMAMIAQPSEVPSVLEKLSIPPDLVIVDSQAFGEVAKVLPEQVPLTSFSMLFARKKGILKEAVAALGAVHRLAEGDKVLISEGCTHHRQCEDIGTTKIPNCLEKITKKTFQFSFSSGGEFPQDLSDIKLVIHCGSCMLGDKEMLSRQKRASFQGVPLTNYGVFLSYVQGTLERSLLPFGEELKE